MASQRLRNSGRERTIGQRRERTSVISHGHGWDLQDARETVARANTELVTLQLEGADASTLEDAERRRDRAVQRLDRIYEESEHPASDVLAPFGMRRTEADSRSSYRDA